MINAVPPGERDQIHIIGRPQGFQGLTVYFGCEGGAPLMRTAWTPTPEELEKLNAGGNFVFEFINIDVHPPCRAYVSEPVEVV